MRTTIDLPDDLFRRVKVKAAEDGLRLKDLIARYIAFGVEGRYEVEDAVTPENKDEFPLIRTQPGLVIPSRSNSDLFDILDQQDFGYRGRE